MNLMEECLTVLHKSPTALTRREFTYTVNRELGERPGLSTALRNAALGHTVSVLDVATTYRCVLPYGVNGQTQLVRDREEQVTEWVRKNCRPMKQRVASESEYV